MSEFFSLAETECKCGCGFDLTPEFKAHCDELRRAYGRPLPMTGGARCPSYNQKVSKTGPQGPHTTGKAADFGVRGEDALLLMVLALERPVFRGFGANQKGEGRFIHLDATARPVRQFWTY